MVIGRIAFAAVGAVALAGVVAGLAFRSTAPAPERAGPPPAAIEAPAPHTLAVAGLAAEGDPPPLRTITVSAVGDIALARGVAERMETEGASYPFALVRDLLEGDIVVGNLEGAFTTRGDPWPKAYNFRTHPGYAVGPQWARFDVLSLANNHVLDYGPDGLEDTLTALDALGIAHPGAGNDSQAAHAAAVVDANGLRVAFLAFVATPPEGSGFTIDQWAATADAPGVAIGTPDAVAAAVAAARAEADFVVVLLHAGAEYTYLPNATQTALAEAALSAGAAAVIGAHAHVVQPVEQRGARLIAWGLGNFVFDLDDVDLANIPAPRVSLILEVTFTEGRGVTAFRVVAVTLADDEDRPRPATADEAAIVDGLVYGRGSP